jgi:hypothetical protein
MPNAGDPIRADDFFDLRSFTPTFNAGVTALGVGNVREGWYVVSGEFCTWGFRIQTGTTPNGNATWELNLPVTAYTGGGNGLGAAIGSWSYRWNGGSLHHYAGTIGVFNSAGSVAFLGGAWDGTAPRQRVGANSSVLGNNSGSLGMNQNDVISGQGVYRIA